jgi:hypothetical protein
MDLFGRSFLTFYGHLFCIAGFNRHGDSRKKNIVWENELLSTYMDNVTGT